MTQETTNSEGPEVTSLPRRRAAEIAPAAPSLAHSRRCTVCHHPARHLIEASFIGMRSVSRIARAFGINNRNTIYAHAHASNLFELRVRWFMSEKQRIMEQSEGRGRIESQ